MLGHTRLAMAGLVLWGTVLVCRRAGGAEEAIAGTVVAVRGEVSCLRAGGRQNLALKDPVHRGDTVETGARGRVQISFADETILSLGRNTKIEITECIFQRSEGQGALHLQIAEGAFRIVGGAIMKIAPENFRADTPTATIGIRGSSFAALVTPDLTRIVLIGTTGAGITVSNDDGYRIVYIPGTGLDIPRGEAPGRIKPMDELSVLLLGETMVGGSSLPTAPPTVTPAPEGEEMPEPEAEEPEVPPVDPRTLIPAYPDDAEAQAALLAQLPDGRFPMANGNAVGLDLANGWALRTLSPEEFSAAASIGGSRLTGVESGAMILHATGTGASSDTFPNGPSNTPPIPFSFNNGAIVGNAAINVTDGTIQPPDEAPDTSNWGWWAMDIADPNAPDRTHHVVGLWQATAFARTAADWVQDVLLGRDFQGAYQGDAHCLRNGVDIFDGTSSFVLDFRNYAFSGGLDFSTSGGPAMALSGTVSNTGIHGTVEQIAGEAAVESSSMRGFFYGAGAQSLQGAFDAQNAANRYIGIFNAAGTVGPDPGTGSTSPVSPRRRSSR
ncbi:MAG: FecR domain-containing protein [Lentisphaeria bacterium]|nr:FecR domain-containing protein [Lentisphaeria bacterium]